MAKWQPPIPGGALTSKPARQLGPALVLLVWCYEAVQRDGSLDFQVAEAAADMDESYYTVRKWWAAIKSGPWFAEVVDRGKRGFRVQMDAEWLEWRIFKAPSSAGEVPDLAPDELTAGGDGAVNARSRAGEVPDMALDGLPEGGEGAFNAPSTRDEVPDTVHDGRVYKVLHDDQKTYDSGAPRKARTRSTTRAPTDETTPAAIRQALAAACHAESGRMLTRVNTAAKAIWSRQQARGFSAEQTAEAVPRVAAYLQASVYPYTKGQPIRPEAIDDHWLAAAEAAKDTHHGRPLQHALPPAGELATWTTYAADDGNGRPAGNPDPVPRVR